ncbi:MAG: glycine cleavage system aminomethyltransferase GcvT [Planctomycetota bacterium]|nr:MAG: glycine cleavage system aminomethyltransferase GcvT [Planctomycetota bacterium]
MSQPPLHRTSLHAAHQAAGAKLVPFAGWEMPLDYGSILEESRTVRQACGLFDVSHMGRFWFHGPKVAEELDRALGGAIVDQPVGKARYTVLLTEQGTFLDDLLTYRVAEDRFFMVVNASNREQDFAVLRQRIQNSDMEDRTLDGGGILALQGPDSRRQLALLNGGNEDFCPAFLDLAWLQTPEFGELFIARTGYTGEHGYEIFANPEQMTAVWQRLMQAGVAPVGLGARDVLRLEAGMPLYGHEIDPQTHPFEAGLRFAIKGWKTREFVGGEALRAMPEAQRRLIGLTAEKRVPRQGYPLLCNGREVGQVCSGAWSATLDKPIATAYLEQGVEGPLTVSARGREFPVEQVDLPFVPHRSRN